MELYTTRNFKFRDGKNPLPNCANSITKQIRNGIWDGNTFVAKNDVANF